jgi:hypothetical protein
MSLESLVNEYAELRKNFSEKMQNEFKKEIAVLFKNIPDLQTIKWNQYTPYFNDGDPCVFSVHGAVFSNAPSELVSSWGDLDSEDDSHWCFPGDYNSISKESKDMMKTISRAVCSSEMEDVMLAMFGDHVKVTITRDNDGISIETEDYDHD